MFKSNNKIKLANCRLKMATELIAKYLYFANMMNRKIPQQIKWDNLHLQLILSTPNCVSLNIIKFVAFG